MALAAMLLTDDFSGRNYMEKNKKPGNSRAESMASIQERLQQLLDEGRALRRQIEAISTDVDFPLTREADGDPRLRTRATARDAAARRRRSV